MEQNEKFSQKLELIAHQLGYKFRDEQYGRFIFYKAGGYKLIIRAERQKYSISAMLPSDRQYATVHKSGNFDLKNVNVMRLVSSINSRILQGYDEALKQAQSDVIAYRNLQIVNQEENAIIMHQCNKFFPFGTCYNRNNNNTKYYSKHVNLQKSGEIKIEHVPRRNLSEDVTYHLDLKSLTPELLIKILALVKSEEV